MGRIIEDSVQTEFHPLVGLRQEGTYVEGIVKNIGTTANGNPVVTLALSDLEGTTSISAGKGKGYTEVDVKIGDLVQVIGSVKQLREKLPQLAVGESVRIAFDGQVKLTGGKKLYKYKVEVL